MLGISGSAVLTVLMALTNSQVRHWKNGYTLFEHALAVTTNNSVAHNGLGVALDQEGMLDEAIAQYSMAVRIAPNYADAHNNHRVALAKNGKLEEAIAHFTKALQIQPNDPVTYANLEQAKDLLRQKQSGVVPK